MKNKIVINGKTYNVSNSASVSVINNKVFVDGKELHNEDLTKPKITIELKGDIANLHIEAEKVEVTGDIKGDLHANSCSQVQCRDVGGNVESGNTVHCRNVNGNVSAGNTIKAQEISGNAKAGNSVKTNPKCNTCKEKIMASPPIVPKHKNGWYPW